MSGIITQAGGNTPVQQVSVVTRFKVEVSVDGVHFNAVGGDVNSGGNGGDAHYPIPGTSPVKWGSPGTDGSQNTGGGGGGGSAGSSPSNYPNFFGGDGGSGIIIISHSYE